MRHELDLLAGSVPTLERDANGRLLQSSINAARKRSNVAANTLIDESLLQNDLSALTKGSASVMVAIASNLIALDEEPELNDFVYGACELVTICRKSIDDALTVSDMEELRTTSVMMEIVMRGICACVGINYDESLNATIASMKEIAE